jgi:hypothetical protein
LAKVGVKFCERLGAAYSESDLQDYWRGTTVSVVAGFEVWLNFKVATFSN